jgi:hypothetical protein
MRSFCAFISRRSHNCWFNAREAAELIKPRESNSLNDKPLRWINSLSLCRTRMYQYTPSVYVCVRWKFQQTGGVFTWHGCWQALFISPIRCRRRRHIQKCSGSWCPVEWKIQTPMSAGGGATAPRAQLVKSIYIWFVSFAVHSDKLSNRGRKYLFCVD